jgi:hypothetical protein
MLKHTGTNTRYHELNHTQHTVTKEKSRQTWVKDGSSTWTGIT